jgi:hypothetical protein
VFRICDKQLLSSFLYQVISLISSFIKLSVSGKADVEYSACTELTAFAPKECLKAYEMQALRYPPLAGVGLPNLLNFQTGVVEPRQLYLHPDL